MEATINMIPQYNTITFADVYPDVDSFINGRTDPQEVLNVIGYKTSPLPQMISEETARTLFYLLYSKYGNNPIANHDVYQFMIKMFTLIWQYGPTWEKRLEIQEKFRGLSETELLAGSKSIMNHAFNPSSQASVQSTEDLNYINDQNVSSFKKGILEAYEKLWDVLRTDVTEEFLNHFKKLFKIFVRPEETLLYETIYEEE